MSEHYERAAAAIPHMSPDERARLLARLKAAQSLSGRAGAPPDEAARHAGDASDFADDAARAICAVILRAHGERLAPAALLRTSQAAALADKAASLRAFTGQHARTRVARLALLEVGFEMLRRDLAAAGFAVTARTLMQCAHQVPAALDKAFPGYAAAGVLGMVVGRER